jgi:hypothetical protein
VWLVEIQIFFSFYFTWLYGSFSISAKFGNNKLGVGALQSFLLFKILKTFIKKTRVLNWVH